MSTSVLSRTFAGVECKLPERNAGIQLVPEIFANTMWVLERQSKCTCGRDLTTRVLPASFAFSGLAPLSFMKRTVGAATRQPTLPRPRTTPTTRPSTSTST